MSIPEGSTAGRSGGGLRRHLTRRNLSLAGVGVVAVLVVAQLVPYGRDHSNPPETRAARWPDPSAEQLFRDSCGDCHSNVTRWRWYSNVAPASWLVQHDVDEGRGRLNISEWQLPQPDLGEVSEAISGGEMPPLQYTLAHPSAKLSDAEKRTLVNGLRDLYREDPPGR